jgi:hypothetical protein
LRTNIGRSLTEFFTSNFGTVGEKKSYSRQYCAFTKTQLKHLPNATTSKLRQKKGDRGAKK